jgi:hypothetical protein
MTDLSFNITWLQKNTETLDQVALQLGKIGDRLDELDKKTADPKVVVDTSKANAQLDELDKKLSGIGNVDIGKGGLIGAAGIAASGAAVAGGLLAIPAAIVAIGVASEKADPQVVTALGNITAAGKQTLRDGFQPLVPAITDFLDTGTSAFAQIQDDLTQSSEAAAPLVTLIGDDFIKAAQEGIGGAVPIIQSLRPAAQAVGDDMLKLEQGAMGFLGNLNVGTASQGLETLGDDVKEILPPLGSLVSDVMPLGNALLNVLGPGLKSVESTASAVAPAVNGAASAINFLTPDVAAYTGPALAFVAVTKLMTGSWTDFSGLIGRVKPLVTDTSGVITGLGQKVGYTTAATAAATKADLEQALVKAQLTKATAEEVAMTTAWAAAEAGTAETELAAVAATEALTAAEDGLAEATAAAAAAGEAATFSFGPLGIALGAAALLALPFILNSDKAGASARDLTLDLNSLAEAAPGAAAGIVSGNQPLADLINDANDAKINVTGLLAAWRAGPQALSAFTDSLEKQHDALGATAITTGAVRGSLSQVADAASKSVGIYNNLDSTTQGLVTQYNKQGVVLGQLHTSVGELTSEQQASTAATAQSSDSQDQATQIAGALGLSVDQATLAYHGLAAGQAYAMSATQQSSDAILGQVLAVGTANAVVSNYFKTADAAVASARDSLADASHSLAQSAGAVADAQHSEAQAAQAVITAQQGVATAQRGVVDAEAGVVTATQNVAKARQAAQAAQLGLTAAEAAATQQLKELHLQLTSQVTSEESARVALFDQQQTSGALGVTAANAQQIAGQTVTATNEDKIKSALDLLKAEEDLNSTLNTGANLRTQVTAADKAGVSGSAGVLAAQQAIVDAQGQVASSEAALVKAHQAVNDAQAAVLKAEQGVADAAYNEKKAHDAVSQAMYDRQRAAQAVTQAQQQLQTAQDNDSHSMDAHTAAGQRNLAMLKQIADQLDANEDPQTAGNDLIRDTADLFKESTGQAQAYLTKLGLIPPNFKFGVTAVASADIGQLATSYRTILSRGVRATPGLPVPFAAGGFVSGPGGPRDDKIPAMLSNKEFVEPADSVSYYGVGMMEAIRNKTFPRFADGGLIDANGILSTLGADYQTSVHALAIMGGKTSPGLVQYTPPPQGVSLLGGNGTPARTGSPAQAQAYAASQLGRFGWGANEMPSLIKLWNQESNWINQVNKSSGAYGIPQALPGSKMASAGADWRTNTNTQINWGLGYIKGRYGSPDAAWAHEISHNWYADGGLVALKPPKLYDSGGWLPPGGTGTSQLGKPEAVLNPEESAAFVQLAKSAASGNSTTPIEIHVHPPQNASVDQIASEVMRRLKFAGR